MDWVSMRQRSRESQGAKNTNPDSFYNFSGIKRINRIQNYGNKLPKSVVRNLLLKFAVPDKRI